MNSTQPSRGSKLETFNMISACFLALSLSSVLGANLVDILQSNGESTLVSLVQKAGLADALSTGTYTVFAPTNAAFAKLPHDLLMHLSTDVNALANVLKYHVVQGAVRKQDASNELKLDTLSGQQIRFNIYSHNNVVTVEGSKVVDFDLHADNGYVHVIDKVMLPPEGSIVDIVSGKAELSTLLAQVQSANLVSALKGDNLTLFAPTNAAFTKLGSTVLKHITTNPGLLKEILTYHVVPHTEYSAGLYNREHVRTLDTRHDTIRIRVHGSTVNINNAVVTKADIAATNGVVHLIDHVLVPFRHVGSAIFGKK